MKISDKAVSRFKNFEILIYTIVWLGVICIPYFQHRIFGIPVWHLIFEDWILISAYLILFILNVCFLIPGFLFKNKYYSYFSTIFFATVCIVCLAVWLQTSMSAKNSLEMPKMELGPGMPPMELGSSMPMPEGYRLTSNTVQKSIFLIFVDYFTVALLMLGASTAFKIGSRWLNEENRRKEIEKEHLVTELALLRHQINPHFLMNTLNNIHALIDLNVEKARDAVIKLSVLMRYILYDTAKGTTQLSKEIEFIRSYVDLMKLRYPRKVQIKCKIPRKVPDVEIPPMLLITFLENAFKHGVSYQLKSFIIFEVEIQKHELTCSIINSKHAEQKTNRNNKYSGIGLENVKKNLELLYKDNYTLNINETENEFQVFLTFPFDVKNYPGK